MKKMIIIFMTIPTFLFGAGKKFKTDSLAITSVIKIAGTEHQQFFTHLSSNKLLSHGVNDTAIATDALKANAVTSAKMSNTGVSAGSYTTVNVTVDAAGRITSISNGSTSSTYWGKVGTKLTPTPTVDTVRVEGYIQSTSGGYLFPDGTRQITAMDTTGTFQLTIERADTLDGDSTGVFTNPFDDRTIWITSLYARTKKDNSAFNVCKHNQNGGGNTLVDAISTTSNGQGGYYYITETTISNDSLPSGWELIITETDSSTQLKIFGKYKWRRD